MAFPGAAVWTDNSPCRLAQGLSLFIALLLLCSTPAYADRKEELQQLREKISSLQQQMQETAASESAAEEALRQSERNISNSKRQLRQLQQKKQQADEKLSTLKQREQQLSHHLREQQQRLSSILRQQYQGGDNEYLRLLLSHRDLNQTSRNIQYFKYIAQSRKKLLDNISNDLIELNRASTATQEQSDKLAQLSQQQQQEVGKLKEQQQIHRRTKARIAAQLKKQRNEISRLKQNENRLEKLIQNISKILKQPSTSGPSTPGNTTLPDGRFDDLPFSKLKGKLALPVKGQLRNRFGDKRADSRLPWKGLFLQAAKETPVKAIAAGQVVFSDWIRGYGNLLVIDHGQSYMSVYGYNNALYKQVGDQVKGGETIASVGNSGGNDTHGLYFELRHKSRPFDPMKWTAE